jgi:hypothetical protein
MSPAASALLPAPRRNRRRIAPWVTVFLLAALAAFLLWRGFDFYRQDSIARTEHKDYATLRAAGNLGHGYGIVGTGLILTNLLYLVRRRFAKFFPAWLGSVKAWLDMHVVTGLGGSLLVLFHSTFQLRTPIATVTAASLAIVVVTGLIGLYLYALVPTSGIKPLKDRLAELEELLPGVTKRVNECVERIPTTRLPNDASLPRTLITIPTWIREARARRRGVVAAARGDKLFRVLELNNRSLARDLILELGDLAAAEIDANAGAAFVRSWRSVHRFLAILMIFSVIMHIAVAWFFGFRWIFSK